MHPVLGRIFKVSRSSFKVSAHPVLGRKTEMPFKAFEGPLKAFQRAWRRPERGLKMIRFCGFGSLN